MGASFSGSLFQRKRWISIFKIANFYMTLWSLKKLQIMLKFLEEIYCNTCYWYQNLFTITKYCTSRINVLVGLISEFFYPVAWWLPVYLNPHLFLPCNHISSAGWVRTIRTSRKRCISTIFLLKKNKHIIHDIIFLNTRNYILNRK